MPVPDGSSGPSDAAVATPPDSHNDGPPDVASVDAYYDASDRAEPPTPDSGAGCAPLDCDGGTCSTLGDTFTPRCQIDTTFGIDHLIATTERYERRCNHVGFITDQTGPGSFDRATIERWYDAATGKLVGTRRSYTSESLDAKGYPVLDSGSECSGELPDPSCDIEASCAASCLGDPAPTCDPNDFRGEVPGSAGADAASDAPVTNVDGNAPLDARDDDIDLPSGDGGGA